MNPNSLNIKEVLNELQTRGISLGLLAQEASQVILFGSWAVGMQHQYSDIDLLCVGRGKRKKTAKVDVVWISPDFAKSEKWRGSELANHVIRYGRWLVGTNGWGQEIRVSEQAIDRKRALICSRGRKLLEEFEELSPDYQAKHAVKLRRDVQRLALMKMGEAVPASPQLDLEWLARKESEQFVGKILHSIGEDHLLTPPLMEQIGRFRKLQDWRVAESAKLWKQL